MACDKVSADQSATVLRV